MEFSNFFVLSRASLSCVEYSDERCLTGFMLWNKDVAAMLLMRRLLLPTLLCWTVFASEIPKPERQVKANVLSSERDPKIRIKLPPSVQYVGADRWPLFDLADCELHVFVEATAQKRVQRLYWLQFEAYLPSRPELHHTYPFAKTETLSGLLFDVRARFGASSEAPKPGSDLEHVQGLLRAKGYQLPEAMMNVRFVHLFDEQKRKELMIIYAEDLASTGFTVEDLLPTGKHSAQWPSLEAILIQRAKNAMDLSSE